MLVLRKTIVFYYYRTIKLGPARRDQIYYNIIVSPRASPRFNVATCIKNLDNKT